MLRELKSGIPKLFYSKKKRTFAGEDFSKQERLAILIVIFLVLFTITIAVGTYLLG